MNFFQRPTKFSKIVSLGGGEGGGGGAGGGGGGIQRLLPCFLVPVGIEKQPEDKVCRQCSWDIRDPDDGISLTLIPGRTGQTLNARRLLLLFLTGNGWDVPPFGAWGIRGLKCTAGGPFEKP